MSISDTSRPVTVRALDAAEYLDTVIAQAWANLDACARVLSEPEYGHAVAQYTGALETVKPVRETLDGLVDMRAPDDQYMGVVDVLERRIPEIEKLRDTLAEWANSQETCTRVSGELLLELSRLERTEGSVEHQAKIVELVAWGRDQVQQAAAHAQNRGWITAHTMLVQTLETVRKVSEDSSGKLSEAGTRKTRVAAVAGIAGRLQNKGARAVQKFEQLTQASPADAAPHKQVIVEAGGAYAEANSAVLLWNDDIFDTTYDLDSIEQRLALAEENLDKFLRYAQEVLQ